MDDTAALPDERLELIFTCCHPVLALEAQVALTLRTLGGSAAATLQPVAWCCSGIRHVSRLARGFCRR
jgi:predicted RNA polymerase sigma factor